MKDTSSGLQKTGPYLHEEGYAVDLKFPSEGADPRCFTLILAEGKSSRPEDAAFRGIAVLDKDNSLVVCDGLTSTWNTTIGTTFLFYAMGTMDWPEFSEKCRTSPRYRGGVPDIDTKARIPASGRSGSRQDLTDIRNATLRGVHEDDAFPYEFPAIGRDGVIAAILAHKTCKVEGGITLAWNLTPVTPWNRTGRIRGGKEINGDLDADWRADVENNPGIIRTAILSAVDPYISGPFEILELGTDWTCELGAVEGADCVLTLTRFAGKSAIYKDQADMADRICNAENDLLMRLWASLCVLDHDLNPAETIPDYEREMHELRCAYDAGSFVSA